MKNLDSLEYLQHELEFGRIDQIKDGFTNNFSKNFREDKEFMLKTFLISFFFFNLFFSKNKHSAKFQTR